MTVLRLDYGTIESYSEVTKDGFLKCNAIVTRTGVFSYRNSDGSERKELRLPEEVCSVESLDTMKMIPVTNDHPDVRLLNSTNAKQYSVGYTGQDVYCDSEKKYISCNFVVCDQNVVDIIRNGKRQLSLGYTVDLIEQNGTYEGERYNYIQKNIVYNHLSIVDSARAGEEARIHLDSNDAIEILNTEKKMTKRKVKLDEDEYMMEPEMADSVERLVEDLKNLSDEKKRVEEEMSMIKDKLEKAMAERDTAKEEVTMLLEEKTALEGEKMDSVEFENRVKGRIKLLKIAEKTLSEEDLNHLDSLSDLDIKRKVIIAKSPSAKLDGKSEVYICARFDAICEEMPKNNVIAKTSKVDFSEKSTRQNADAKMARAKMIEDMKKRSNGRI